MASKFTGSEIYSCKTKRTISVDGNIYRALVKAGYTPVYNEKTSRWELDHPTLPNKCHPRRASPKATAKKTPKTPKATAKKTPKAKASPKRPQNAFQIYQAAALAKLKAGKSAEELKGLKLREKVIAKWRSLSPSDKKKFEARAAELKEEFLASGKVIPKTKRTPRAKKISPTRAAVMEKLGKKPKSAFFLFSDEFREQAKREWEAEMGMKPRVYEVAQKISEYWNAPRNAKTRAAYERQAARAMAEYMERKAEIMPAKASPKRRANANAYIIFANEQRDNAVEEWFRRNPTADRQKPTEVSIILGEMWRALTPSEKREYESQVVKASPKAKATKKRTPKKAAKKVEVEEEELDVVTPPKSKKKLSAKKLTPKQKAVVAEALQERGVSAEKLAELVSAKKPAALPGMDFGEDAYVLDGAPTVSKSKKGLPSGASKKRV